MVRSDPLTYMKVVGCGSQETCSYPKELADSTVDVIRSTHSLLREEKIHYFEMLVVCCGFQLGKICPQFFDDVGRGTDFSQSPIIIILCADTHKSGKLGKGYAAVHAEIARKSLLCSAQRSGFRVDWTSWFDEDKIRNIFMLPSWFRVVKILSLHFS